MPITQNDLIKARQSRTVGRRLGPRGRYSRRKVRIRGVLTAAEQQLVKSLPAKKGRDLLKQVRIQLIETARPVLEALVQEITGVKMLSLHHDISTVTGEEVVLFTLAESPLFRETKRK
jgi:uncharacterized protein YbcI